MVSSISSLLACYIPLFVAGVFSSGAGIGGGSVNVAILLVIGHFSLNTATILSFCTLCGNLISQVLFNSLKTHPYNTARPLVYWELVLVLLPAQQGGIIFGLILQKVLPESLILVLALCTLAFAFAVSLRKFLQLYKFETLDNGNNTRAGSIISTNYRLGMVAFSDYDDAEAEYDEFEALVNEESDNKTSLYEGRYTHDENSSSHIYIKQVDNPHALSGLPSHSHYARYPWLIVYVFLGVWILYLIVFLITRRDRVCSWGYIWIMSLLYPVLIGEIMWGTWFVKQSQRNGTIIESKGDVEFEKKPIGVYCLMAFFVGILCSMLGLGGGELMGPMLLSLKVLPQVSTATTAVMSLMNSMSSVVYYLSKGRIPFDHGLICFAVGGLAGFVGRVIAYYQTKGVGGRPSFLILALMIILTISFCMNLYNLIVTPRDFQFQQLCHGPT